MALPHCGSNAPFSFINKFYFRRFNLYLFFFIPDAISTPIRPAMHIVKTWPQSTSPHRLIINPATITPITQKSPNFNEYKIIPPKAFLVNNPPPLAQEQKRIATAITVF